MGSTGLIVLAAGASTRLGQPKQLLPYRGSNLLQITVESAIASVCQPIVVVLGAYAEKIQPAIAQLPVQFVQNERWAVGMGTSIQCGLRWIETNYQPIDAVVLLVCDQPFITPHLINRLVETYRTTGNSIVASAYANTVGVPVLFSSKLFPTLNTLAKEGAKPIIKRHRSEVATVSFPAGKIDIDTPTEAQKWLGH